MAATAAFPALSVPAPEDTMEISSPAHLPEDNDNDIDLDFGGAYDGGETLEDDEQMVVDGEQAWAPSANDASMDDDAQQETQETQEAYMRDDQMAEDDELIDYDEDFLDEPQVEDTVVEDFGLQPSQDETLDIHNENTDYRPDVAAEIEEPDTVNETVHVLDGAVDVPQSTTDEATLSQDTAALNESVSHSEVANDQPGEAIAEVASEAFEHSVDGNAVFPAPLAVDTTCLLYTSPSPRDGLLSRMPSSA